MPTRHQTAIDVAKLRRAMMEKEHAAYAMKLLFEQLLFEVAPSNGPSAKTRPTSPSMVTPLLTEARKPVQCDPANLLPLTREELHMCVHLILEKAMVWAGSLRSRAPVKRATHNCSV
jgi:hypothetical protein